MLGDLSAVVLVALVVERGVNNQATSTTTSTSSTSTTTTSVPVTTMLTPTVTISAVGDSELDNTPQLLSDPNAYFIPVRAALGS